MSRGATRWALVATWLLVFGDGRISADQRLRAWVERYDNVPAVRIAWAFPESRGTDGEAGGQYAAQLWITDADGRQKSEVRQFRVGPDARLPEDISIFCKAMAAAGPWWESGLDSSGRQLNIDVAQREASVAPRVSRGARPPTMSEWHLARWLREDPELVERSVGVTQADGRARFSFGDGQFFDFGPASNGQSTESFEWLGMFATDAAGDVTQRLTLGSFRRLSGMPGLVAHEAVLELRRPVGRTIEEITSGERGPLTARPARHLIACDVLAESPSDDEFRVITPSFTEVASPGQRAAAIEELRQSAGLSARAWAWLVGSLSAGVGVFALCLWWWRRQ